MLPACFLRSLSPVRFVTTWIAIHSELLCFSYLLSFFMLVKILTIIYKSEHLTFLLLSFLEITSTGYHTTFKSPFQQLQVQI